MNTDSCDMRRIPGGVGELDAWLGGEPQPGEFMILESVVSKADPILKPQGDEPTVTVRSFIVVLPDGQVCSIPLRPVPQTDRQLNGGHSWEWDGNQDKPTLTPSIHAPGRWHGWVRAGRLVSC